MFADFRFADPEYIDFEPKTVQEAILKFRRLEQKGIQAWMYPEALIKCGGSLPEEEMVKFEQWMINPTGEPDDKAMDVRDFLKAQKALDIKHGRDAMPALEEASDDEDEKKQEDAPEEIPEDALQMPALTRQESGPVATAATATECPDCTEEKTCETCD